MTDDYTDLRTALREQLRAASIGYAEAVRDAARTRPNLADIRKVAAYLPYAVRPEPTPEQRAETARWAAEQDRLHAERIASHAGRVEGADGPMRDLLVLHAPIGTGRYDTRCGGCDIAGTEAEPPDWPCRTYDVLAGWTEDS